MREMPPGILPKLFRLVPARHRDDAAQEAWVAYLEAKRRGVLLPRTAWRGANAFQMRERRAEQRMRAVSRFPAERQRAIRERMETA